MLLTENGPGLVIKFNKIESQPFENEINGHKKKNKTKIENDVFIGSNCSLIAPIVIGKNSTIGAGSVINKNIPINHLAIERSEIKILKKRLKK